METYDWRQRLCHRHWKLYLMRIRRTKFVSLAALSPASGGPTYTGPGDVVGSATAWWGLRAYSAATIGGNVVDIKRASDNTTQTFVSLTTGALDVASIATFLTSTTGVVTKLYDQTGHG